MKRLMLLSMILMLSGLILSRCLPTTPEPTEALAQTLVPSASPSETKTTEATASLIPTPASQVLPTSIAEPILTKTPLPPTLVVPSGDITLNLIASRRGTSQTLAVQGITVLLGMGALVKAIDVSAPGAPHTLGQSALLPGIVQALVWRDTLAFVSAGRSLIVLDTSDPANLRQVGSLELPGVALSLLLHGDTLYA